jgi:hypothetical protein
VTTVTWATSGSSVNVGCSGLLKGGWKRKRSSYRIHRVAGSVQRSFLRLKNNLRVHTPTLTKAAPSKPNMLGSVTTNPAELAATGVAKAALQRRARNTIPTVVFVVRSFRLHQVGRKLGASSVPGSLRGKWARVFKHIARRPRLEKRIPLRSSLSGRSQSRNFGSGSYAKSGSVNDFIMGPELPISNLTDMQSSA